MYKHIIFLYKDKGKAYFVGRVKIAKRIVLESKDILGFVSFNTEKEALNYIAS